MERTTYPLLSAVSGLGAIFIGLGLCRFAYSPMVPSLVAQGWLTSMQASSLIAINLVGYFVGAVWLKFYGRHYSPLELTKWALLVCSLCLFGRSLDVPYLLFSFMRFLVGFFGAILVIITASHVVTASPAILRTKTNAIIFTGMGMGIALSGILVAEFAKFNLSSVWFALAVICLITAIISWIFLPKENERPTYVLIGLNATSIKQSVVYLTLAYTFMAAAFVPHLLFLVDYLTVTQGYSHANASLIYTGLGIGATIGGFISHWLARLLGVYTSLLILIGACIFLTLGIFSPSIYVVGVTCFLIGMAFTATVMLKSTRLLELDIPENHACLWTIMTLGFAIGQVVSTYLVIYLNHILKQFSLSFIFAAAMFATTLFFVAIAKNSRGLEVNMI